MKSFSHADVTLTAGPFEAQAAYAREFFLGLNEDSVLQGFRQHARQPAPGRPMGGWYDPEDFAAAHCFGQFLSTLSRGFAYTGDTRYRDKVTRLVHGFNQTGVFYASDKVQREWPCYVYDKNCTGLRDAHRLTGNEEALHVLKRMTDWAFPHMPRRSDEWYTLGENLYACHELTGDTRYLQMAQQFDYSHDFYDPFARGQNVWLPVHHAYSHVNSLASAAKAYEVTGQQRYLDAIRNAWELLVRTQMYPSGGWGPNEHFVLPGGLAKSIETTHKHFEVPCGSYANTNLDRYLLRGTGEAKYGDNMERTLLNCMLAALPIQEDGRSFYYADYSSGARKQYFNYAWPCCAGTYGEVTADYPLNVWFYDTDALYLNLFIPSEVRWKQATVSLQTAFPDSDELTITVHAPARFALHVRIPQWTAEPQAMLDGEHFHAVPGSFLRITREWQPGDTLHVRLPMPERIDALGAVMRGPTLLARLEDGTLRPLHQIRHETYTTFCPSSTSRTLSAS